MSGSRRFDPAEIRVAGENEATQAELASALAAARQLEALAASDGIRPTDGFEDRVMSAIATQPAPRVAVRSGSAVRGGPPAAFLLAVREAWGVATTGGRPIALRAQALAFVLLVLVAVGSLAGAGAVTVGGLLSQHESPAPSVTPDQTISPTPSATPAPTPTMTDGPTSSPEATETPGPGETSVPGATSNPGGPGATDKPGETARPTSTPKAGQTPRPTETPRSTETPDPEDTPEPSDDHGGDDSGGGGSGPG